MIFKLDIDNTELEYLANLIREDIKNHVVYTTVEYAWRDNLKDKIWSLIK